MQESDGKITSAKVIDWDKATIISADNVRYSQPTVSGP